MADESVESEGFFEMLWDCPHCDTKGLLGKSQRHCPECGAPQDETKRYFPTPEQQKAVPGHIYVGADRKCVACGAPQSAAGKNCTQCGAPLEDAPEVGGVGAPPATPATASRVGPAMSADAKVAAAERGLTPEEIAEIDREVDGVVPPPLPDVPLPIQPVPARQRAPAAPPPPWSRGKKLRLAGALALLAVALFAVWWQFLRTTHEDVVVAGHEWVAKIGIDEYGNHSHSAWRDKVPPGATGLMCSRKTRSTRSVSDGTACHTERHDKKDGTFEQTQVCSPTTRSVDVDDDWCAYDLLEWAEVSADIERGSDLSPRWPEPSVPALVRDFPGNRRQGTRTLTLTLRFAGADSCDVPDAVWRKYKDHDTVRLTVRARSGAVVCGDL